MRAPHRVHGHRIQWWRSASATTPPTTAVVRGGAGERGCPSRPLASGVGITYDATAAHERHASITSLPWYDCRANGTSAHRSPGDRHLHVLTGRTSPLPRAVSRNQLGGRTAASNLATTRLTGRPSNASSRAAPNASRGDGSHSMLAVMGCDREPLVVTARPPRRDSVPPACRSARGTEAGGVPDAPKFRRRCGPLIEVVDPKTSDSSSTGSSTTRWPDPHDAEQSVFVSRRLAVDRLLTSRMHPFAARR